MKKAGNGLSKQTAQLLREPWCECTEWRSGSTSSWVRQEKWVLREGEISREGWRPLKVRTQNTENHLCRAFCVISLQPREKWQEVFPPFYRKELTFREAWFGYCCLASKWQEWDLNWGLLTSCPTLACSGKWLSACLCGSEETMEAFRAGKGCSFCRNFLFCQWKVWNGFEVTCWGMAVNSFIHSSMHSKEQLLSSYCAPGTAWYHEAYNLVTRESRTEWEKTQTITNCQGLGRKQARWCELMLERRVREGLRERWQQVELWRGGGANSAMKRRKTFWGKEGSVCKCPGRKIC